MRIAYLGNFRRSWDTESYISRALVRAGCEVTQFEERDTIYIELIETLKQLKPDVFLFAKGRLGANRNLSTANLRILLAHARPYCGKIVSWQFDLLAREFNTHRFHWAYETCQMCDLFLVTDGFTARQLPKATVLRQGIGDDVRPGVFRPGYVCDLLFLGAVYGDRDSWLARLQTHFQSRFRHVEDCRGAALNDLMASAKVIIGPGYPRFAGYWSNRIYVATGYGGCFAAPEVLGMRLQEGWQPDVHYYSLSSDPEKRISQLEYLISDEPFRQRIREAGQNHCLKNFTYDQRVAELLHMLGK